MDALYFSSHVLFRWFAQFMQRDAVCFGENLRAALIARARHKNTEWLAGQIIQNTLE